MYKRNQVKATRQQMNADAQHPYAYFSMYHIRPGRLKDCSVCVIRFCPAGGTAQSEGDSETVCAHAWAAALF